MLSKLFEAFVLSTCEDGYFILFLYSLSRKQDVGLIMLFFYRDLPFTVTFLKAPQSMLLCWIWKKLGVLLFLTVVYKVSGVFYSNSDPISLCCLDYDEQSSHTSVIRANYVFLLETLDVKFSGLVAQLYSDNVVSAVERDDITAEKTSFRANEKLLSALSHKSPQQFQLFLDALDNCGQPHVRNVITAPQGLLIYVTFHT